MKIAPSILSADFSVLKHEIGTVSAAEWIHIDVMDGHFVPNITIGPDVIKALRPHSRQVFDTHLMITEPEKYADAFIDAGSDQITFHIETVRDPLDLIKRLHSRDVKAGLSLKPATAVDDLFPYLKHIDLILVMSVEPGFGGQSFLPGALEKIAFLSRMKEDLKLSYDIVVDGGINETTATLCRESGATVLVAGSHIFSARHRKKAIRSLR